MQKKDLANVYIHPRWRIDEEENSLLKDEYVFPTSVLNTFLQSKKIESQEEEEKQEETKQLKDETKKEEELQKR